jgi:hypothetical protein
VRVVSHVSAPPSDVQPAGRWAALRAGLPRQLRSEESLPGLALVAAIVLGLGIRLYYVLPAGFPLNDGGLFYAMARDIQHAHYALPAHTSYNGGSMPFAYPPLLLYVLALLDDATPLSLFDILRWLPLIVSVATIPVFYILARAMLPTRIGVAAAVLVFGTIQNGFEWHIMGGGITRAPALLFSLLSIYYAYRTYQHYRRSHIVASAVFASLALLTHPDLFVVVSVALLFVVYGRTRRGLFTTAVIASAVLVMTAPWWATVIARHGLDTLLATGGSRTQQGWTDSVVPLHDFLTFPFTKQPLLNWPAVLALIGGAAALVAGQVFFPLWLIVEELAEPHQAPNFIHVPVALLVGWAAGAVIAPAFRTIAAQPAAHATRGVEDRGSSRRRTLYLGAGACLLAAYFLTVALFSALNEPGQLDHLKALDKDQRALMDQVNVTTPDGAPFLVVSGLPWWGDRISEWFPALTHAQSLFTAQGAEWLGDAFTDRITAHEALQQCATATVECLDRVAREHRTAFTYVYVDARRGRALLDSLRRSGDYRVLAENAAGAIAERATAAGQ